MVNLKVNLQPIVNNINMPTVIKTAILPDDLSEGLFIATQVGEIFYIRDGVINLFLDIRPQVLELGIGTGGYDERGLLGLAFHPEFHLNGLFYLHYSVAHSQGPGSISKTLRPDPCDPESLNRKWINRESRYDHIDTVEEWILQPDGHPGKRRTLLNIRRPFSNHNGFNSLNFSPETGKLVLTTGDGGSGYDPFNLSQNDMEIAGKIIEIDIARNTVIDNMPVVTRFNELPTAVQEMLTVIAKGVRNISGISFLEYQNQYIKYIGNVGQDLVEAIYSFVQYKPIPVTQIIQASLSNSVPDQEGFINFGWRGWEGILPTSLIRGCRDNEALAELIIAYYNEAVETSVRRLPPIISYFHSDPRPDKFGGTALTGVHPYMGNAISDLTGSIVFIDLSKNEGSPPPARGALAYTKGISGCNLNDFGIIEPDYDFGSGSAYYISLGTNLDKTRLYLGVYGSPNVANLNQGTIFEIIP